MSINIGIVLLFEVFLTVHDQNFNTGVGKLLQNT